MHIADDLRSDEDARCFNELSTMAQIDRRPHVEVHELPLSSLCQAVKAVAAQQRSPPSSFAIDGWIATDVADVVAAVERNMTRELDSSGRHVR